MKHLPAIMTPGEFSRRTGLDKFRPFRKKTTKTLLQAIRDRLQRLPPKTQPGLRWQEFNLLAVDCMKYLGMKTGGKLLTDKAICVETLAYQCLAREYGERMRAKELFEKVSKPPATGVAMRLEYTWETILKADKRIHGEEVYEKAHLLAQSTKTPLQLQGKNSTEVNAPDLYAIKALYSKAEWNQIQAIDADMRKLIYIDEGEALEYKMFCIDNEFRNVHGRLIDTRSAFIQGAPDGYTIWVMTTDCENYCKPDFKHNVHVGAYQHSSLAGGKEVLCAGTALILDGELIDLSNQSGHYRPSVDDLYEAARVIQDLGYKYPDYAAAVYGDFTNPDMPRWFRVPMALFLKYKGHVPYLLQGRFEGGPKPFSHRWAYDNPQAAASAGGRTKAY